MHKIDFKYAKAQNFLCFGEEGIEIDFTSYGNIVCIKGRNLDVDAADGKCASNGSGKCFGIDTPILMFDGTIKVVQDVKVGDLVMGNDSTPRKVLSLGRGREPLYRVVPKKGKPFVVNESHILSLKSSDKKYDRTTTNGECINISVKDYLASSKSFKHLMRGYRAGVEFQKKETKIEPYFLGLWLGDGSSNSAAITNVDSKIIERIYQEAKDRKLKVSVYKKQDTDCCTYEFAYNSGTPNKDAFLAYKFRIIDQLPMFKVVSKLKNIIPYYSEKRLRQSTVWRWIEYVRNYLAAGNELPLISETTLETKDLTNPAFRNSLLNDLREYNLLNNKHIPDVYKHGSKEDRLQLLAGIFDTDAARGSPCGFDISSKFETLANDIVFVARSLGLAAYVKETYKSSKKGGRKKKYYRVTISGDCDRIPVRIEYKKCSPRKINKDPLVFGFKIEPIGEGDYYGFAVDGNHLFLLGDFTVVHNSSIPEIIVYALYGKTIKKPKKLTHIDLINNKAGKKLYVELLWNDYRVVRTRDSNNKGTLRIWKSAKGEWTKDTEITKGVKKPQEMLEKEIKYTYDAFINVFVFSDDNTVPFLECDTTSKREIVENLLSLDKYRGYFENANKATKEFKNSVKELTKEYEFLCSQKDTLTSSVAQIEKQEQGWYESKTKEVNALLVEIKKKRDELENSSTGSALAAYQEAQEQLTALKDKIPALEEKKTNVVDLIAQATKKGEEFEEKATAWKKNVTVAKEKYETVEKLIKENKKIVSDIEGKTGKNCPYCRSVVSESNFADILEQANAVLTKEMPDFETLKATYEDALKNYNAATEVKQTVDKALNGFKTRLNATNLEISEIHCSISKLSKIEKPDSSVAELRLSEQLESLKLQVTKKQEEIKGATPFEKIKETAVTNLAQKVKECNIKDEEIKKLEAKIPYYEFWVKAFGDNGIRKYVIDGIIPILNGQIEYWLQFLIDNKIKLVFDNTLDATIDRYPFNGRAYVYHGMSGGQRRRLNLTVAAAWELVSALNSGVSLSAIFLDEVTMNMDEIGVLGIYRMICELAKEKQVFVIDHNESLLQMLSGCDVINIEMRDEITHKVA